MSNILTADKIHLPLDIPVIVTEKEQANGVYPCIILKRYITSLDLIKSILSCAFHEQEIIVIPRFSNKLKSIGSLIEKGLIYYNEKDRKYYFTR